MGWSRVEEGQSSFLLTLPEVHLANWFFEGARADISKVVSAQPAFQLQHSFSLGQQSGKYNFGAIWTNSSVSLLVAIAAFRAYLCGKLTCRPSCRAAWTGLEL
jgi:hypothetical protein